MVKYPLAPNGIFWTLQGEGALQGEPMVFVRLAGCSVGCPECDTDYRVDRRLTPEEIVHEIRRSIPEGFQRPWVWITGGEPTDHDLVPLVDLIKIVNLPVAIATSGIRLLPATLFNWISVSPHSLDIAQAFGHELKVVSGLNGLTWDAIEEMCRWASFPYRFVQPLSEGRESVDACIRFVLTHPGWRLTTQAHKGWNLP